jgi:uncharacterized protein YjiS (DUF1127 family)
MAVTDTNATHYEYSILDMLTAPFRAYMRFCENVAERDPRHRRAQLLAALSDKELATLGMKREDIVRHVYGGLYCA